MTIFWGSSEVQFIMHQQTMGFGGSRNPWSCYNLPLEYQYQFIRIVGKLINVAILTSTLIVSLLWIFQWTGKDQELSQVQYSGDWDHTPCLVRGVNSSSIPGILSLYLYWLPALQQRWASSKSCHGAEWKQFFCRTGNFLASTWWDTQILVSSNSICKPHHHSPKLVLFIF